MSNPQKLPIDFKAEVSFAASIGVVRQLSEGSLHRDPQARVIQAEPKPTNIRPFPARQIQNPRIRVFRPMSEWQVRLIGYAARTGKTLAQIQAERAARVKAMRRKAKGAQ